MTIDTSMDPKITIFFALIAAVIGLSHLSEEKLSRLRRWRENHLRVPSRRRT